MQVWVNAWPTESKEYAENVFRSFTEQMGYPIINIQVSEDRRSFIASQKRFLLDNQDNSNDASLLYAVPISYTTNIEMDFNDTSPQFYLNNDNNNPKTINMDEPITWIIANIQQSGYYRVNYDEATWNEIKNALSEPNWGNIHQINRAEIVDDLLNLARAGEIEYKFAFNILEYLETETEYLPWAAAFRGLSYIAFSLDADDDNFAKYILENTKNAYEMLGFEETTNDTTLNIYNRAQILSWSCRYGNNDCIANSKSLFDKLKTSNKMETVPVNIRSVVYCTAIREGTEEDFYFLVEKYQTETIVTEKNLILDTLGCVKNPILVEKYYKFILSDEVRRQDKVHALNSIISGNIQNREHLFKLITSDICAVKEA